MLCTINDQHPCINSRRMADIAFDRVGLGMRVVRIGIQCCAGISPEAAALVAGVTLEALAED